MATKLVIDKPVREQEQQGRLDPCVLVIVGATGDLAGRKLAPAIWNLHRLGHLPAEFAILGVSRGERSDEQYRDFFRGALKKFAGPDAFDEQAFSGLANRMSYQGGDLSDAAGADRLAKRLARLQGERPVGKNVVFYLATPSQDFEPIVRSLGRAGLVPRAGGYSRVIIEKPFGYDLESARRLNAALAEVFGESETYRIDHYLGKETVQNLMVMRFSNSIFELMWNREHIDHVQITVAETLGVENRARFFEETGILRDIAQNHLMQLLELTAMEPPAGRLGDSVRDEKVKVIGALRPLAPGDLVAGQYAAGAIAGQPVVGYRQEPGVAADSTAETYVAWRAFVDTWRWAGVPFYLRCGKRLAGHATEIAIQFHRPPLNVFRDLGCDAIQPNRLLIHIQPEEGITLQFGAKVPGPKSCVQPVNMDFRYGASFSGPLPDAYQRLLLDVMEGNPTLFLRRDAVEAAWSYFEPVLDAWAKGEKPLAPYPAGSWGPAEAERLMTHDDDHWRKP